MADECQIAIYGPGYGECVLIKLDESKWVVVDSCRDNVTDEVVALRHLNDLGIDPATAVSLIVVTHWHDDHIRGLAEVIAACPDADVVMAAALKEKEFLGTVLPYREDKTNTFSSGVRELYNALHLLYERGQRDRVIRAIADRRVLHIPAQDVSHGMECSVWTLSPCDAHINLFYEYLNQIRPLTGETRRRIAEPNENDLSVVCLVSIGPLEILLGGDLQEHGRPELGWSAILASQGRPRARCSVFKVPHHGSENAHHEEVWSEILSPGVSAVITPYNRGKKKLPSKEDLKRIGARARFTHLTSKRIPGRWDLGRSGEITRSIKEFTEEFRAAESQTGGVVLTAPVGSAEPEWQVEYRKPARQVS